MKQFPVSIIIPVYNVEAVLDSNLKSLLSQTYPILEVILIDNNSTDRSVEVAKKIMAKHKKVPMRLIQQKYNYGLSYSYNVGAAHARSRYIVSLHSDSMLLTRYELALLMRPILEDPTCVAAMPLVVHRVKDWKKYNFWQKCLFAQSVGKEQHNLNGKFDAYNKSAFLRIGGYDTKNFNHNIGSEDADMHFRLRTQGVVASTNARVIHLHGINREYSLFDWIRRRRFLAISYARQIKLHWNHMGSDILPFMVKPVLACLTFGVYIHPLFIFPILLFPFWYMKRMFMDSDTRKDVRIVLLPFIIMWLVFAETVWMIKALFVRKYSL